MGFRADCSAASGFTFSLDNAGWVMQRLDALLPRPRLRLMRFHGVLAPNAKLRTLVVSQGQPQDDEAASVAAAGLFEVETAQGRVCGLWSDADLPTRRPMTVDKLALAYLSPLQTRPVALLGREVAAADGV